MAPQIVVDSEQARLINESPDAVQVVDAEGNFLGFVTRGITEEDIAIAQRSLASDEPRYTTQQVLEHLRSLEG